MMSPSKPQSAITTVAVFVSFTLAACAVTSQRNAMLEQARVDVSSAQNNPHVSGDARTDLMTAEQALGRGDAMLKEGKPTDEVNHEAYVADRFALAAQKGAERTVSEAAIADANNRRTAVLLAAREQETARANEHAQSAARDAEVARNDAQASARQADLSAQQNEAAQQRAEQLESELADLQAKKTDRGLVITLGDVLFATGRAELQPGARHSLDKLSTFLHQYPQRSVQIEGFTDSVGSDEYNQGLSERRAAAVGDALTGMGVASGRITTRGLGKSSPVSANDTATGRQQNRRVEVIISEGDDRTATRAP